MICGQQLSTQAGEAVRNASPEDSSQLLCARETGACNNIIIDDIEQ